MSKAVDNHVFLAVILYATVSHDDKSHVVKSSFTILKFGFGSTQEISPVVLEDEIVAQFFRLSPNTNESFILHVKYTISIQF